MTGSDKGSAPAAAPTFHRNLGVFDGTMLVAGSMIGSGIFIVSSGIAREVGSSGWLLAVWVLTGIMTIFGALSYAELAAMMPQAGGQYVYLRETYGPLWAFLYGWTVFLVIQTGTIAALGVAFSKFLGVLVPWLGDSTEAGALTLQFADINLVAGDWSKALGHFHITAGQGIGVLMVILLTAVNCRGIEEGKWIQNLFTLVKTLALAAVIVLGFAVVARTDIWSANMANPWSGIYSTKAFREMYEKIPYESVAALMVAGAAVVGALFASDAYENVTFIAGEVKDPQRAVPRSLVLGTGMVIILYILANVVYLAALPINGTAGAADPLARGIDHAEAKRVGTAVMELVSPDWGVKIMAIAIMISTFGCANGFILSGARLYYAMARDGVFFRAVGQLNHFGVPAVGLILQAAWTILLIFSGTYDDLFTYVVFANVLFYAVTVTGLFILRRTQPNVARPYRVVGYPIVPGVFVFLCAAIMLDVLTVKWDMTWRGLLIVLTGVPVYFLWKKFRGALSEGNISNAEK